MPLDEIAKKYAELLYLKESEVIAEQREHELQKTEADFRGRNILRSGMHSMARAKVIAKYAGLMVEAKALAQAYARAGKALDETVLQEIIAQVNKFSGEQKSGLLGVASGLVPENLPSPTHLSGSLVREMHADLARATARAIQDLTMQYYELVLDRGKAALAAYAAAMGKQWDVFISHASEDKETFVRPLARALEEPRVQIEDVTRERLAPWRPA